MELRSFRFNTNRFGKSVLGLRSLKLPTDAQQAPIFPTNDLPTDFDWRDHGYLWVLFGLLVQAGALEGANFLATGKLVSLSEQQLVDCDHECDSGCKGGLMNSAFEYTLKSGGLQREEDYPYAGNDRANFSDVSIDDDQIAANLVKSAPLAVAINAVYMQTYIGGVSSPYICSKNLEHGVLLVGYAYWIIKNSWGPIWGEKGYYKICRGPSVCGVEAMVSTMAAVHVNH
ncbi:hypothetical protein MKW92_022686 [Papaver armeniacum]|nr:hypothetical protein MKW92_022686 [Papaver armeniacum]